jgi:sensor histidine kinase YesM
MGFLLLLFSPLTAEVSLPTAFWIKQFLVFSMLVGIFYLNAQVWVPRFLFQNRIGMFIGLSLLTGLAVLLLTYVVEIGLNVPEQMRRVLHPDSPKHSGPPLWALLGVFISSLFVLGISTTFKAVQKWQQDAQLRLILEQQKISSELSFLKAQINPHFFFNTLNNVYSLTMFDVEAAREALHTLSQMMRYVLYETHQATCLSKEVAFIQNYINLMKIRLTDNVTVTFNKPTSLNDVPIAPMLLLPFLENAFKHGVSNLEPSSITISLCQTGPVLDIEVRNTLLSQKTVALEESNGIGLVNTRRRLDLLYPKRYQLLIRENTPEQEYVVHLTLDLAG